MFYLFAGKFVQVQIAMKCTHYNVAAVALLWREALRSWLVFRHFAVSNCSEYYAQSFIVSLLLLSLSLSLYLSLDVILYYTIKNERLVGNILV